MYNYAEESTKSGEECREKERSRTFSYQLQCCPLHDKRKGMGPSGPVGGILTTRCIKVDSDYNSYCDIVEAEWLRPHLC
ncbi:hypothetical protein RRG08_044236 [Elysia crispata]|uniref:Uncharacterized protein n=1 Tax=Elysia crispata TaxID=231223 RepID=A0AAE1CNT3_9GAST|nr:hypothetical protein RRG08_044236 [Elysia crispata]